MLNILLYISNGLVITAYILYLLMILFNQKKSISKSSGFYVAKDIIEEYNSINIIESSGYFTIYNLKRKIIKLTKNSYYGNTLSMISISLIEAGNSIIDNKNNKYINLIKYLFNNLKILYIFPLLSIFINNSTYSMYDAKINIIILAIFCFISYMVMEIKRESINWIKNNINKVKDINQKNQNKIINFINRLYKLDQMIIYGEIIMISRMVIIILQ